MLVELVAQPHCLYFLYTEAIKYVYTILPALLGYRNTVRLLVPGHFYFYAVSKFSLRENDISALLL